MIIFYNKNTGKIVGSIEGRIHGDEDLNMWIGDKGKNDRIVVQWKQGKDGNFKPSVSPESQRKIFEDLDKSPSLIYNFKINPKTRKLISND